MMWVRQVNKREFAELLSSRRAGEGVNATEVSPRFVEGQDRDATIAIWPAPPKEFGLLPSAIVVPSGAQRDFLAWVATYVRDFKPFTAFCRVVERPIAERLLTAPVPTLRQFEGVCSGMILGESLAQSQGRIDFREFPLATYPATLSYALSRSLALTGSPSFMELIVSMWAHVRDFTGQPSMNVPSAAVATIWSVALGFPTDSRPQKSLFESSDGVREAWNDLISGGEINEKTWAKVTGGIPELGPIREMTRLPREKRLEFVDVAMRILVSVPRDGGERWPFLVGYLTSILSPGTLDHIEVLTPAARMMPTAFLWYGVFAGLNIRGEALPIGNSIARRIIRDVMAPDWIIDRPKCDIAFEELAMVASSENGVPLRNLRPGRLDIDLMPGVTMAVRWPPQEASNNQEMQRVRETEAHRILMEMEETATRQRMLADRLREMLGMNKRNHRSTAVKRKRGDKSS